MSRGWILMINEINVKESINFRNADSNRSTEPLKGFFQAS